MASFAFEEFSEVCKAVFSASTLAIVALAVIREALHCRLVLQHGDSVSETVGSVVEAAVGGAGVVVGDGVVVGGWVVAAIVVAGIVVVAFVGSSHDFTGLFTHWKLMTSEQYRVEKKTFFVKLFSGVFKRMISDKVRLLTRATSDEFKKRSYQKRSPSRSARKLSTKILDKSKMASQQNLQGKVCWS